MSAMPRFFNTAGPCNPEDHYMLPPERRLPGIRPLIDEKAYFVVHARSPVREVAHLQEIRLAG
jgi:hypothetical protein